MSQKVTPNLRERSKYFSISNKARQSRQEFKGSQETKDWTWSLLKLANDEVHTSSFLTDSSDDNESTKTDANNDCDNNEFITQTPWDMLDNIANKISELQNLPDPKAQYKEFKKSQLINNDKFRSSVMTPYQIKYGEPDVNLAHRSLMAKEAVWMSEDFRLESMMKRAINYSISQSVKKAFN